MKETALSRMENNKRFAFRKRRGNRRTHRRSSSSLKTILGNLPSDTRDMTDTEKSDWYDDNVVELLIVFGASVAMFLLLSLVLFVCLRLRFSAAHVGTRESLDSLDLTLVKSHTRAVRFLSLIGVLLQLTLLGFINNGSSRETSERTPYLFSLVRPVLNICVYFLGFMTNTHGAFRVLFLVLAGAMVVSDTVAEVTLAMMIDCTVSHGLQCGSAGYLFTDVNTLQALKTRDVFNLFLNPWLLLEVGYLCVAIGVCSSRYSKRQLSLSRPRFNIRAGLALYFPDQFGVHARARRHGSDRSRTRIRAFEREHPRHFRSDAEHLKV